MACNPETPTDGAAPAAAAAPPSPTPGSCPTSESLMSAACCNSNCRLPGCSATMSFCSNCSAERLLKEESAGVNKDIHSVDLVAKAVSAMGGIPDAESARRGYNCPTDCCDKMDASGEAADASSVPEGSDLRVVVESKGFSSSQEVGIVGPAETALRKRSGDEEIRIRSPPMPSPSKHDLDMRTAFAPPQERSVNRCSACRKRLGLRGFKCRCGDLFCALHRYSDKHDCSFDYKAAGRLAIAKENPLVISRKVIEI